MVWKNEAELNMNLTIIGSPTIFFIKILLNNPTQQ
jgi:hypothetical protein